MVLSTQSAVNPIRGCFGLSLSPAGLENFCLSSNFITTCCLKNTVISGFVNIKYWFYFGDMSADDSMNNHNARKTAFPWDTILQADSGKALSPDLKLNCQSLPLPVYLCLLLLFPYLSQETPGSHRRQNKLTNRTGEKVSGKMAAASLWKCGGSSLSEWMAMMWKDFNRVKMHQHRRWMRCLGASQHLLQCVQPGT